MIFGIGTLVMFTLRIKVFSYFFYLVQLSYSEKLSNPEHHEFRLKLQNLILAVLQSLHVSKN